MWTLKTNDVSLVSSCLRAFKSSRLLMFAFYDIITLQDSKLTLHIYFLSDIWQFSLAKYPPQEAHQRQHVSPSCRFDSTSC